MMELKISPMDKAVDREDMEFIKKNFDGGNTGILLEAIGKDKREIFEYAYPLFSQEDQIEALSYIAFKGRHDYLDFALQYLDVNKAMVRDANRDIRGGNRDIIKGRAINTTNTTIGDGLVQRINLIAMNPHAHACRGGHMEMVERLESLGLTRSEHSFKCAFATNNLALIKHLHEGQAMSEMVVGQSYIMPLDVLQFMMSQENLSQDKREKILFGAASVGYMDVLEYLLALPDAQPVEGLLFETAYFGKNLETMKYLMEKAPIRSSIAEYDYDAFIWAYEKGYEDYVEYLVQQHGTGPHSSPEVRVAIESDNGMMYAKYSNLDGSMNIHDKEKK